MDGVVLNFVNHLNFVSLMSIFIKEIMKYTIKQ